MSITDIFTEEKIAASKIYGVVTGIVTNNQDPDKLGRVKVKIPTISAEDESNWARVASFMSGNEKGVFFLPEVDDEVLVAFEYGNIEMPYIIGSLWNGKSVPPQTNSDGENNIRMIKSRCGHVIQLKDKEGEETIEIIDKDGKNSITIDTKNNKIVITSGKDIELNAAQGKIILNSQDIEIKTSASAKIEASSTLDIKASGNLNIKGSQVNIN